MPGEYHSANYVTCPDGSHVIVDVDYLEYCEEDIRIYLDWKHKKANAKNWKPVSLTYKGQTYQGSDCSSVSLSNGCTVVYKT
jgi:hypothetical protein